MKPIEFEGKNIVMGEGQPEYTPLPAFKGKDGEVVTCWQPETFWEWVQMIFTRRIYIVLHTFNQPLQPMQVWVENPLQVQEKPKAPDL